MKTSDFIELDPRGSSSLEVGARHLKRWLPFLFGPCLRGIKSTRETKYGMTDGRHPYMNEETINTQCDPAEAAFILGHEDGHVIKDHVRRLKKFEGAQIDWRQQLWSASNVGADLILNDWLRELNRSARAEMVKAGLAPFDVMKPLPDILIDEKDLYDTAIEDLSAEQLTLKLIKMFPVTPPEIGGPQSQAAQPEADENSTGSSSEQQATDGSEQQATDGSEQTGNGEASLSPSKGGGEATSGEFGGGHNDFCEPELVDGETVEEFHESNRREVERAVFEQRMNEDKGLAGATAGCASFVSSDIGRTSTQVRWEDHLSDWFRQRSEEGFDRPFCSRSYQRTGIARRARGSKVAGELVFVVDTSGSNVRRMGPMLDKVQEVLDKFQPQVTHVVPCDTRVHTTHEVLSGGLLPETLEGGGGTRFKPAFDWIEDNAPMADGVVFLTDGHTARHEWPILKAPDMPLLWLCFGYHPPRLLGTQRYTFGERVAIDLV